MQTKLNVCKLECGNRPTHTVRLWSLTGAFSCTVASQLCNRALLSAVHQ